MIFGINIDIVIFLAYLALNLAVGLKYGRNVKTIQDYALGGRNFTTGALVATIVGTWASGSMFFSLLSRVYSDGLYFLIALSFCVAPLFFVSFVFAARMGEFLGKISVAEIMGDLYGKNVRIITAVSGMIGAAGLIAVQFKAFGNVFHYFLNIDSAFAVIAAGVVMTTFSAFGGIRSITFTDVLQCITFCVAIPLIGFAIWLQLHGDSNFSMTNALSNPKFNIAHVLDIHNPEFWAMIPLLLYFLAPDLNPAFIQRVMMGASIQQVKKAFNISAVIILIVILLISWIPFLIFNVNPNLEPNQLLPYIVDNYTYTGLKGLTIIAVVALAISTADANMNISSVLFAHDICKPLGWISKDELRTSRIFACILGVLSVTLALFKTDLLSIILAAQSFYMPIVTPPLIMTILGFRSSTLSILTGMGAGLSTVIIWNILNIEADCIVFAMFVNLIFLLLSHYILRQPGGWVGIKDRTYLDQVKQDRVKRRNKFFQKLRNFTILGFLKEIAPKNDLSYAGFGIYCIICTLMTMYLTNSAFNKDSTRMLMYFYQVMLVTSTIIGSFPLWPHIMKKEIIIQILWPIVIFYMLGFFSAFFLMVTGFEGIQFSVFTVNAIVVLTLVGWRMGAIIIVLGFYLASLVYQSYAHVSIDFVSAYSVEVVCMYIFLLLGAAVVIFLKPKEDAYQLAEERVGYLSSSVDFYKREVSGLLDMKSEFLRNIEHESRTPITGVASLAQVLDESYDKIPEDKRREVIAEIARSSEKLNSWASNLVDLSRLSVGNSKLEKDKFNFIELVEERLGIAKRLYDSSREFSLKFDESESLINGDRYYLGKVIDNVIVNAMQYSKGMIELLLKHDKGSIEFSIKDSGIGIPPEELFDIFGTFTTSSKTKNPSGGRGVGLALCKKVIELHGGKIWAESDGVNGTKIIFKINRDKK